MNDDRVNIIVQYLDRYIENTGKPYLRAPEANQRLAEKNILQDRPDKSGLPLRKLLRRGLIPHAYQNGVTWIIPHSSKGLTTARKKTHSKPDTFLKRDPENIRASFRPNKIRVLMIGESPPAGGTFFYFGNSNLYHYTVKAFSSAYGQSFPTHKVFFKYFKSSGFYLDDLCIEPVNNMVLKERKSHRMRGVSPLATRIKLYSPEVILCLMKGIEADVRAAVQQAGFSHTRFYSFPFPSQGNQTRYVQEMVKTLKLLEREDFY